MSLQPGKRVGPYEVLAPAGAGGMGEVYKARDTRLERTVAIKILPDAVARDAERRERFEREAKAISSLNHPNICVLHDIGREDDVDFLVMEYIEGDTLAERLAQGPLPFTTALEYSVAIADALNQAHRSGVVHRDLKPGNVMLTASGIKLLDFGLAKFGQEGETAVDGPEEQTQQKPLTSAGTLLGTVQYMSPEQLEGKEADPRADVFAFGALVYEMVTGRRAFHGESQASLIGAIMNKDPAPMMSLEPLTPPELERVIRKCLAKDREERWQSAGDLRDALQWVAEPSGEDTTPQPTTPLRSPPWLVVAGLLAAAVIAGSLLVSHEASDAPRLTHAVVPLEPHQAFVGGVLGAVPFAISPDGKVLAYTVNEGTSRYLYIRNLNGFESRRVEPSDGANSPFFSPDSQWVGFFRHDGLFKASAAGGAPVRIGDGPAIGYGADWGLDGTIVYSSTRSLSRVSAEGGTPELILAPSDELSTVVCPRFLPPGDRILFGTSASRETNTAVLYLETGEWSRVPTLTGTSCTTYLASGHLVQDRSGSLWAGRFDTSSLEFQGPSSPILENLHHSGITSASFNSIADNGALIYAIPGPAEPLLWVDRDGRSSPAATEADRYRFPRLDRADERVVVSISRSNTGNLWVLNLKRGSASRLGIGDWAAWGPEASMVTVVSLRDNIMHRLAVDSPSDVTPIYVSGTNVPGAWSEDGSIHAFYKIEAGTNRDIWILKPDGTAEPFLATEANERTPYPSPDGARIAYVSDESGRDEVYVRNYPDTGKRWLLSTDGGREPVWSADGREVFYRNGWQMLAVDVGNEDALDRAAPRVLFEERYGVDETGLPNYDVSQDGQRFLMVVDSQPTQMRVIANWGDQLETLLGEN